MSITFDSVAADYDMDELDLSNIKGIHLAAKTKRMAVNKIHGFILTKDGNLDYYAGLQYEEVELKFGDLTLYCNADERVEMIEEWMYGGHYD